MIKHFILIVFLACGICTYAQVITINDSETGRPIELATLYSKSPQASATTNAEGQTDISKFENSEQIASLSFGYI